MLGVVLQTTIRLPRLEDVSQLTSSNLEHSLLEQLPPQSSLVRWAITRVQPEAYVVDVSYQLDGALV